MAYIEINPDSVLLFMASKSEKEIFKTTPKELREFASMEGFLQSLKFESIDMQRYVCTLVGKAAKKKGHKKNWYQKQELYWNGRTYKRDSEAYQNLLNRAYNQLYKNGGFYKALQATNGATLEHSIGKNKSSETVLTRQEFCSRLTYLRDRGELPEYDEPKQPKQMELGI